jgi:hypothetical protein
MEKTCIKCKSIKDIEEYPIHKGKSAGFCKQCKRDYDNEYYKNYSKEKKDRKYELQVKRINKIRKFVYEYLQTKSCTICGENRVATLNFDHQLNKEFNISNAAGRGYSLNKIKIEILKCIILCSNCHRVKTANDLGWYNYYKN